MSHLTSGCADARSDTCTTCPCSRYNLLLGLDGPHVEQVERDDGLLMVTVSTPPRVMGCPGCGVVAVGRGRRRWALHDVPGASRVQVIWRQRIWRCADADCYKKTFVEQLPSLVAARGSITTRAVSWAIGQLRREHTTIARLTRQLGTSWKTVWRAVEPELQRFADDDRRCEGVRTLGVDEHIWHHSRPPQAGPERADGDGRSHPRPTREDTGRPGLGCST